MTSSKKAIIIGAGPAGLTAAYELLTRTDIVPIVLEQGDFVGGIARTVNYKGNRMDIGGHRFFSKSDRVMEWWHNHMPFQSTNGQSETISYQRSSRELAAKPEAPDPEKTDEVMLIRNRKSRIYFLRKFFDYPIAPSPSTFRKLGLSVTIKTGFSYLKARLCPIKPETNLEQFFINRFGRHLYSIFFKSYTEKVWGVPCNRIDASWGAQRVKGLSLWKTLVHGITKLFKSSDISQKTTETSLIERFLYPKFGPGQLWELVTEKVRKLGGQVLLEQQVKEIMVEGNRVTAIQAVDLKTGKTRLYEGDYFFSTMPVKDLLHALQTTVPQNVKEVGEGLIYRDFLTVGLLLDKLKVSDESSQGKQLISDNWVYIQEPDVLVGRLQIFNNWSPYMVADKNKVWVGLEYFCNEGDELWTMSDQSLAELGASEMEKIGMLDKSAVLDCTVIRVPKTYPAYFGTYDRFPEIISYLESFENLFLVGRNGMHKYNNQDHSMLAAMTAVDNIIAGITSKDNLWQINTDLSYQEEK